MAESCERVDGRTRQACCAFALDVDDLLHIFGTQEPFTEARWCQRFRQGKPTGKASARAWMRLKVRFRERGVPHKRVAIDRLEMPGRGGAGGATFIIGVRLLPAAWDWIDATLKANARVAVA